MNATQEKMGRKRRRSDSEEQNVNFDPTELNRSAPQRLKMSSTESQPLDFIQEALSNFLILRNIFTFLDDRDLDSCCNVSQFWRTVADPLVFPHNYDVKLENVDIFKYSGYFESPTNPTEFQLRGCRRKGVNIVKIKEKTRYNRESSIEHELYYSALTQKLDKVLLTHKISINLEISSKVNIKDDAVLNFLSKFGFLVRDLSFDSIETNVVDFCKILVRNFPNIKKLDTAGLHLTSLEGSGEDQFNQGLSRNKHKSLRKISFHSGSSGFDVSSMGTFLKIFENLEEIECFPLALIDAIRVAQKVEALKSLSGVFGGTDVTAYEKLVRLQPKLTSLRIHPAVFWNDRENSFEILQPCLFSVLLSSQKSLKFLQIPPVRSDSVQHFPSFEGLQELELIQLGNEQRSFFPPEMSLRETFPHVTKISFSEASVGYLRRNFPENLISPWGSHINHLKVGHLYENSLPIMQRLFPSIRGLGMTCSGNELRIIFQKLSRLWPQLNLLSISVGDQCHDNMTYMWEIPLRLRLDHAFTGLPDPIIDQLEDPSRKNYFTQEEIQQLKDQSIIYKMKELRKLELAIGDFPDLDGTPTYMYWTSVAQEFGFNLLPELKVTVKTSGRFYKRMQKDLEPLTRSGNFEIHDQLSLIPDPHFNSDLL